MVYIIGLGNPGSEYENTRHNVGFMFIGYLINQMKSDVDKKRLKHSIIYKSKNIILTKPQTFMNRSGEAVKEVAKWFDINIEKELILVHDDLDISLGKYKHQFAKSPKDHKGVISVENHLGTNKFWRVRIGVDNRQGKPIDGDRYVLERFKSDELLKIMEVFEKVENYFKKAN